MFERFKNETKPKQETESKNKAASAVLESAESILAQEKNEEKNSRWFRVCSAIGTMGMSIVMLGYAAESAAGGNGSELLVRSVPLAIFTALEVGGLLRSEKRLELLKNKKEKLADVIKKEQNIYHCPNCGKQLNQDDLFCYDCGAATGFPKTNND